MLDTQSYPVTTDAPLAITAPVNIGHDDQAVYLAIETGLATVAVVLPCHLAVEELISLLNKHADAVFGPKNTIGEGNQNAF